MAARRFRTRRLRRAGPVAVLTATLLLIAGPSSGEAGAYVRVPAQQFETLMERGVDALQAGRLDDAVAAFRAALRMQPGNPVTQTLLGSALLQQEDVQGALELLAAAVQSAPDYHPARSVLGRAYSAAGRFADAVPELEAALRLQPDDSASRALLANALLQEGRLEDAADHAAELASRYPDQAAAQNLLGTVQLRRGRFAEALDAYRKTLAVDADNVIARYGEAAALTGLERGDEAVPILARLVDEHPDNVDALVLLGELLSRRGVEERLDAVRFYRSALESSPGLPRAVRGLAGLYLDLGLDTEGIELIRESGDRSDPQLLMALGRMLERENQYDDARETYQAALEAGAGAEAHYRLGVVLVNLADLAGAAERFEKALALDRRHPTASRELGSVRLDLGDIEGARAALDHAIASNPDDAQAWYLAGVAYLRSGDAASAEEHLRTALELDPNHTEALFSLGTALRQQGKVDESRDVLARLQEIRRQEQGADATEVRAQRGEVILRNGYIRYRIGEYAAAEEMLEQVLDLRPDEERAWYYLGQTRAARGDEAGAITALERASELNPDRPGTWLSLSRLYERAGRSEDARRALERAERLGRRSRQDPADR